MHSATRHEQRTPALRPIAAGIGAAWAGLGRAGNATLDWMVRVGERSAAARGADRYRQLNALGDEELAALGLHRHDLIELCFGARALY